MCLILPPAKCFFKPCPRWASARWVLVTGAVAVPWPWLCEGPWLLEVSEACLGSSVCCVGGGLDVFDPSCFL